MKENELGIVHIYTGDGKGKTTAAAGLSIRCLGAGYKVIWVSFLKNAGVSEHKFLAHFEPQFTLIQVNKKPRRFYWELTAEEKADTRQDCLAAYGLLMELITKRAGDVIVLDEIMAVMEYDIFSVNDILEVMQQCHDMNIELILTGRNAPPIITAAADLVTEMHAVKHPLEKGITARYGIEY
ncbi:MAG: cob(I)yrinic acid a,c-diamide adenosyltransferase [Syntrophomonas sp.]|nr:cob(I)yrinic acid a,c-diamide adenosyltransferase [Syntrophomonas sp.]